MPTAKVKSSTGETTFNYTISTPSVSSATSIDNSLPTLLFIHGIYYAQQIFQRQLHTVVSDCRRLGWQLCYRTVRGPTDTKIQLRRFGPSTVWSHNYWQYSRGLRCEGGRWRPRIVHGDRPVCPTRRNWLAYRMRSDYPRATSWAYRWAPCSESPSQCTTQTKSPLFSLCRR